MIGPKVSILIPTYNNAHFLDDSISSALNQTFKDFELIIVDNASTDNTKEVVEKYLADARVTYRCNETNIGLVGNLNRCLEYASGEYIKFLLADDKFHPSVVGKMVAAMDAHLTVSLVASYKYYFGTMDALVTMPFQGLVNGKEVVYETLRTHDFIGDPTVVMFRRSNLHLGGFRQLAWTCDWEMWIRHLCIGDCYFIAEPLVYIRKHPGQHTNTVVKQSFGHRFEEYYLYRNIKDKNEYNLDVSRFSLNLILKKKAINCAIYIMFPLLLKISQPSSKKLFFEAAKIVHREKVLFVSFFAAGWKFCKRGVEKISSNFRTHKNSQQLTIEQS